MKINKLFLGLFCAAALLTACSDDDNYQWAPKTGGNQVYFSNTLPTTINLSRSESSFNIPVSRVDSLDGGSYSVALQTESKFITAPASVSFNAGQRVANLTLSYLADSLKYDDFQKATVTITDEANVNDYGAKSYTFSFGIPSPYISIGNGTFTDNFWFEAGAKAAFMQNSENPNVFRIMAPFDAIANALWADEGGAEENLDGNQSPYVEITILKAGDQTYGVDITQDDLVTYSDLNTGYYYSSYDADVYMLFPGRFKDLADESYFLYNRVIEWQENGLPGRIQLAPYYYMFGVGGWNNTQADGIVIIDFPGYDPKDYSIALENLGVLTDPAGNAHATIVATLGDDATDVRGCVVKADADPEEVAATLAAAAESEYTAISSGTNFIPIPEGLTGKLNAVVAVVDEGKAVEVSATGFEYYGGGANPWKPIGTGLLTDNFFITMYSPDGVVSFDPETFEVEIEENSDEPGLIRLVAPFEYYAGEDFQYTATNFEINASDPDAVYFTLQPTGIDDGDGMTYLASYGGYMLQQYDAATLKENGNFGTLKDGIITLPSFPVKDDDGNVSYTFQGIFAQGSSAYRTGIDTEFKLVMPEAVTASARAKAHRQTMARRFMSRMNLHQTDWRTLRSAGKHNIIDRRLQTAR